MNMRTAMVLNGETLDFSAVAAASDGSIVPVVFTWEVDDPIIASVEETEPGSATVTGLRRSSESTSLFVRTDRGHKLAIPLTVHNQVKGIVITPAKVAAVEKGDPVELTATAYDKASGDDKTTNDGNEVSGVTFSWSSSNTAVATVDTKDSNMMPMIKTHGAGKAKTQASIGDVKSNEVEIEVYSIETPTRRIVVDTSNQPYIVAATIDTSTTDVSARTLEFTSGPTITVKVQQIGVKEDGDVGYIDVADGTVVTYTSLNSNFLNLGDSNTASTSDGDAGYAIVAADLGTSIPKMVGKVNVNVRITSPFAPRRHVSLTVDVTGR